MNRVTITVSIDSKVLADIDNLVAAGGFASRSDAFETAVRERLRRMRRARLRREVMKLDPAEEQAFANEGDASIRASPFRQCP